MFLQEQYSPSQVNMTEIIKGKDMYLRGLLMAGEVRNGNKRMYPKKEIQAAVEQCSTRLAEGFPIMGELQHPNSLTINLDRVSHLITQVYMDGNHGYGKLKILNTPCGLLAKALIEGGARIGVSTRGQGNLDSAGVVSQYVMETVDLVAVPSAPGAYPELFYESLQSGQIDMLTQEAVHDARAQEFLLIEIKKFLDSVVKK